MDVLCHALESYTARPFTRRAAPGVADRAADEPGRAIRGATSAAARRCGCAARYLRPRGRDASDTEAREQMMWAATLAGIAFGNAGVHAPHAMAYAVAGRVRDFAPRRLSDRADRAARHGGRGRRARGVRARSARSAPSATSRPRALLGADTRGADAADGGELARRAG